MTRLENGSTMRHTTDGSQTLEKPGEDLRLSRTAILRGVRVYDLIINANVRRNLSFLFPVEKFRGVARDLLHR